MDNSQRAMMLDESNRELYSVPLASAIDNVNPDDLLVDESVLRARFSPTVLDYELKQAFWREIALAQKQDRRVVDKNIFHNRCVSSYFYARFLKDTVRIAWMLHPITSYEDKLEAILDGVVTRYNEILKMDITVQRKRLVPNAKGEMKVEYFQDVDSRKALVLLQAIKTIEDRVKGAAVQKQLQIRTSEPTLLADETSVVDMGAVDARLKELEDRLNPYKGAIVADYTEVEDD